MPQGVIGTFGSTTVAASVDQLSSLVLALAFRRPSRLLLAFLAWLPLIVAPPPGDTWPSEDPPHIVYRGHRSRSRDGSSSGRAPGGGRSRDGTLGPGGRAPGGYPAPGTAPVSTMDVASVGQLVHCSACNIATLRACCRACSLCSEICCASGCICVVEALRTFGDGLTTASGLFACKPCCRSLMVPNFLPMDPGRIPVITTLTRLGRFRPAQEDEESTSTEFQSLFQVGLSRHGVLSRSKRFQLLVATALAAEIEQPEDADSFWPLAGIFIAVIMSS